MSDTRYGQPPIVAMGERPVQDVSGVLGSRIFAWIGDIIILAILGSGEFFGEMAPLTGAPRSAMVISVSSCGSP